MMRIFGFFALAIWLGGCVALPYQVGFRNPAAPSPVQPLSEGLLPEAAQQRASCPPQTYEPFGEVALEPAESLAPVEEEVPDLETQEDNLLLSSANQSPPENEGLSVAPVEEVAFDFPVVENDKVRYYIDFYTGPGKRTFRRWLERSGRYLPLMRKAFAEAGLPQDLAYLAMVESGFNDRAYSWAHAVGPWQFIESTGKGYGLKSDWWRDERRDFEKSTRAATRFLKDLHCRFEGNWYLAVAAYNAGGGKISRAISKYNSKDFWEISRGKYLQQETKNYVPKLLAVLLIAKEPEKYGFTDLNYHQPLDFETVEIPTTTDLEVIAKLSGTPYEELKQLNPELKRWCTPPGVKNYQLRLPAGTGAEFKVKYAALPKERRANYKHHRIKSGDTLLALSKRYNIRVADIISLNQIRDPRSLRIGTDLILPLHPSYNRLPVDEMQDDYVRTRRRTYTVRNGDSLWSIAQRFDVGEKDLRVWNRLGWSNVIRPGQTLIVSSKAVKRSSKSRTASKKSPKALPAFYQVKAGDSLWSIARRFDVSAKQLRAWNQLGSDNMIRPGQKLYFSGQKGAASTKTARAKTPLRKIIYQVRPGDSLWTISRRYDVATSEIMNWNNLGDDHILRPGDKLTLLVQNDHRG